MRCHDIRYIGSCEGQQSAERPAALDSDNDRGRSIARSNRHQSGGRAEAATEMHKGSKISGRPRRRKSLPQSASGQAPSLGRPSSPDKSKNNPDT
eukprot:scaffold5662_cov149-Isochrysis_galbana.AAC.4